MFLMHVADSISKEELLIHLSIYDVKRLEMYCRNLVDYHLIVDLVPVLAKLYFAEKFVNLHLSAVQSVSQNFVVSSLNIS